MKKNGCWLFLPVCMMGMLLFTACSNREVRNLQSSVSSLETRLVQYQQKSSQESAETVSRVGDVNESINSAFRDIRYSQSNMETLIDQLSNRLSRVERDMSSLQQNTNQINTFSNDSYASLTEKINQTQGQSQQTIDTLKNAINTLAADLSSIKSENNKSQQSIQAVESRLQKQITTMDAENRKVYRQILQELGANVPDDSPSTSPKSSTKTSASPKVPASPPKESVPSGAEGEYHEIQSGETLTAIARKYGVSMESLMKTNNIDNPSHIEIGQRLKIPKP